MERRTLGRTGIKVSRMCLGTLTVGALQMRLPAEDGARLFERAFDMGINFFDSAKIYGTHEHLAHFLSRVPRGDVVIATKSYDYTYDGMLESVEQALRELKTDYIDIYLMHEQESRATLKGHSEAFSCLEDLKRKGVIRAIGVSTHACEVAEAAPELGFLDVLHPMFNHRGIGLIDDGGITRMEKAVEKAHKAGLGTYAMKVLGGGLMIDDITRSLFWATDKDYLDAIALGVANEKELELDAGMFNGRIPSCEELKTASKSKSIIIEQWCEGCGVCVAACRQGAIYISEGKARVDRTKCVLCGYCGRSCPGFHIRIV